MLKSHIRDSKVRNLLEKVRKKSYNQYLMSIVVENLRIFEEARVSFDFPITAIIGSNSSGKTTLMTASACIYKSVKPSDFFTKSSLDKTLQNAKIRFEVIDKKAHKTEPLKASISHRQAKWDRRVMYERAVKYFGIKRTLPPTEQKELTELRSKNILPTSKIELNETEIAIIQRILGFDSKYTYYAFEEKDLFVAINAKNTSYSEFHFGAGESSIARLVYEMERLPDNALVLIEEIENGLHPSAVVRLVEYLFDVCDRKRHQVIFTTHSNYAIETLPNESVWHCHNGSVSQGKVNIEALRVLVGDVESQLVVFTEDAFAKIFVTTVLRQTGATDLLNLVEIYPINGKNEVIRFVETQNANPATSKIPAVGILDGDVLESEFEKSMFKDYFIKLPGDMPEKEVWDYLIREKLDDAIVKITLKLGLRIEQQNFVRDKILETNREVLDTHLLYVTLGEKLGFMAESVVVNAFITTYVDYKNGSLSYLRAFLENKLPK
jgi:AAA15 family ATPase/GTPase